LRHLPASLLLLAGVGLAILGVALVLNVLSLRELALESHVHPAIVAVFDVRDGLSHRRAQLLELLMALAGLVIIGFGGCLMWQGRADARGS
jgi:drug/metabolite transporter (DMT)-like permease